jgi:hypothetical protein
MGEWPVALDAKYGGSLLNGSLNAGPVAASAGLTYAATPGVNPSRFSADGPLLFVAGIIAVTVGLAGISAHLRLGRAQVTGSVGSS